MPHGKLRALGLHGWRTSGAILAQQLQRKGLAAALDDLLEIDCIDAPHTATGPPQPDVAANFQGPYFEWWDDHKAEDGTHTYMGWEESLDYLAAYIRERGPFDGLVGFSQGAIVSLVLAGLQRRGLALGGLPGIKFCLLFSPFQSRDPRHAAAYEGLIDCPAMVIVGEQDPFKSWSLPSAKLLKDPVVMMHRNGHSVPGADWEGVPRVRAFLEGVAAGGEADSANT
ncbi:unnamed protein product [Ostreobium quekettii]|uniref:Serine hydrolase domain-containing protein n=1 Tax=Ostreobium quekettii TaxID=121088 RepID=A0A8S1ITY4_9CHLO|nr:unnamed protein product [Ostreobium quekettii]